MTSLDSPVRVAAEDRWDVVFHIPADAGDLGLHRDDAEALQRFRGQLTEGMGAEAMQRYGPTAEKDFMAQRAALQNTASIWAGIIVSSTIDFSSLVGANASSMAEPSEELIQQRIDEADVVMVALLVTVTELPPMPHSEVLSPAAGVARVLKNRYGDGANTHILDYDGRPAVAAVHVEELQLAGATVADVLIPAGTPPVDHLIAEVHVLFPEVEALATVTAATLHPPSLDHAVLLAGAMARTVRIRAATEDASPGSASV